MSDVDLTDSEDQPLLQTLAAMTAVSVETSQLELRELQLVRLAALAASGAPPASYLVNLVAGAEMDITIDDVTNVLVTIAPIVGTARVTLAAGNVARALGLAVMAIEEELNEQLAGT